MRDIARSAYAEQVRAWKQNTSFRTALRGIVGGGFLGTRSLHALMQRHTDGAIARFYRRSEWRDLIERAGFVLHSEQVKGQKSEVLPLTCWRLQESFDASNPRLVVSFCYQFVRSGIFLDHGTPEVSGQFPYEVTPQPRSKI